MNEFIRIQAIIEAMFYHMPSNRSTDGLKKDLQMLLRYLQKVKLDPKLYLYLNDEDKFSFNQLLACILEFEKLIKNREYGQAIRKLYRMDVHYHVIFYPIVYNNIKRILKENLGENHENYMV